MGRNQTLKNRALQSLEGKWMSGCVAALITLVITSVVGQTSSFLPSEGASLGFSTVWTLLCLPLSWGCVVYFLNLIRNADISWERVFDGYKDFVRIFLAMFLVNLCVAIGFILLIVPGVIVFLMFSQTSYILKDNKEMSVSEAMKESKEMMEGHKAELFWLILSFIGWAILSLLTFGIGFLLLIPYYYSTMAHFYEDLKATYV